AASTGLVADGGCLLSIGIEADMTHAGVTLVGAVEPVDGDSIATQFVWVNGLPLFPIGTFYVSGTRGPSERVSLGVVSAHTENFFGIARRRHAKSLAFEYARWAGVFANVAAILLALAMIEGPESWREE